MFGALSRPWIDHAQFQAFIRSRPVVIIKAHYGVEATPSGRSIVEFFSAEHSGRFAFGVVDSSSANFRIWFPPHVQKALPTTATSFEGYYLFSNGCPIAYHCGAAESLVWDFALLGVFALAAAKGREQAAESADRALERIRAGAVIQDFQAALLAQSHRRQQVHHSAPAPSAPTHTEAAYSLLGIPPTADYAQAKSAYRHQLRQFHTDLNGNVTDGARKLLEEHTRKIVEAFKLICRERGWRG
jgi:DnaJ-domain-containing protein 1